MNCLEPCRHLFRIFEDNCSACNHRHYYRCPVKIPKFYCRCGHKHCHSICKQAIHSVKNSQYVDKKVVKKPIYEIREREVPITKYTYEFKEVEEDITKYKEVTRTRNVTKYKKERRLRNITQNVTKGKYITETVAVQVFQSRYYPDGSGRSTVNYIPKQKYITYTETETIEEPYYEKIPYEDVEEYTERIPYTVREKVTKTIEIPYLVYETKKEEVTVGYKDIIVEEVKTKSTKHVDICNCITCTCSTCKPKESICNCIRS